MSKIIEYASFIVRIWRIPHPHMQVDSFEWQSKVEHIQSGNTWSFTSFEQFEAFSRQQFEHPELWVRFESQPDTE